MAVIIYIPAYLQPFTGGRARVAVTASATTVGEALAALWAAYPGVRDRVVNEQGEVREHVNVFAGSESIRFTGGLATPVSDGSEISIIPAVSGGSELLFAPR